jgi:acetylornithine deacetylase
MRKEDVSRLVDWVSEMVQINSISPSLFAHSPGEAELAGYLVTKLEAIGCDVDIYPVVPGRPNVIGTLRGSGGGRSLMLNVHTDTVGVEGMVDPFSGRVVNNRIYGRGAQDMKGSIGAMLTALDILAKSPTLRGDVVFTAVVDEEARSIGMQRLTQHCYTDGAIVAEPTELRLVTAHRGFNWFEFTTFGVAAHGSDHLAGVDAIMAMGVLLVELDSFGSDLLARPADPLVGTPALHASTIKGGTEPSVYPAICKLMVERRTVPGEASSSVMDEFESLLRRLACRGINAKVEHTLERLPFAVQPGSLLLNSLRTVLGEFDLGTEETGAPFWTDAALLGESGIDTVIFGPRGGGLHSAEEWVDIDSIVTMAEIIVRVAENYCS